MESVRSVESISGFDRKFLKAKNRITAILLLRSRTLVLLYYKAESKTIVSVIEFSRTAFKIPIVVVTRLICHNPMHFGVIFQSSMS